MKKSEVVLEKVWCVSFSPSTFPGGLLKVSFFPTSVLPFSPAVVKILTHMELKVSGKRFLVSSPTRGQLVRLVGAQVHPGGGP